MNDTTNKTIQYETRAGKIITAENTTIKRRVSNYKNPALTEIYSYMRKVEQLHRLCKELNFNHISLTV